MPTKPGPGPTVVLLTILTAFFLAVYFFPQLTLSILGLSTFASLVQSSGLPTNSPLFLFIPAALAATAIVILGGPRKK